MTERIVILADGQLTFGDAKTAFGVIPYGSDHVVALSDRASAGRSVVATGAADSTAVPAGTETILLVEDEAGVRSFTGRALESLGYEVIEAENGADALAQAKEHGERIDLVVSDVVMPRMGGVALAERLRAASPGLPILLVSGFAEEQLGTGEAAADFPFLAKPFSREALGRAVRLALDAAR